MCYKINVLQAKKEINREDIIQKGGSSKAGANYMTSKI
jgi:hypothetical protein